MYLLACPLSQKRDSNSERSRAPSGVIFTILPNPPLKRRASKVAGSRFLLIEKRASQEDYLLACPLSQNRDSNPRPFHYEGNALPPELFWLAAKIQIVTKPYLCAIKNGNTNGNTHEKEHCWLNYWFLLVIVQFIVMLI